MIDDFSLSLQNLRKLADLTQAEVAHLIGGKQEAVSRIETGERLPTILELCSLSVLYGRTIESLLGDLVDAIRAEMAMQQMSLVKKLGALTLEAPKSVFLRGLRERLNSTYSYAEDS